MATQVTNYYDTQLVIEENITTHFDTVVSILQSNGTAYVPNQLLVGNASAANKTKTNYQYGNIYHPTAPASKTVSIPGWVTTFDTLTAKAMGYINAVTGHAVGRVTTYLSGPLPSTLTTNIKAYMQAPTSQLYCKVNSYMCGEGFSQGRMFAMLVGSYTSLNATMKAYINAYGPLSAKVNAFVAGANYKRSFISCYINS